MDRKLTAVLARLQEARREAAAGQVKPDASQGGGDLADVAGSHREGLMTAQISNHSWERIRAIDKALDKVRSGDYGICDECGATIAKTRLRAVPWADTCRECQESRERQES